MPTSVRNLLLVEDNEDDIFFLRRALRGSALDIALQVVTDGQQAVDYLAGEAGYGDRTRHPEPDFMLLDLKLPYLHGFEVLRWIRNHPRWKNLTVVILTSSPEERDRQKARELCALDYQVKPPSRDTLTRLLGTKAP